jgi:hypothetical protein
VHRLREAAAQALSLPHGEAGITVVSAHLHAVLRDGTAGLERGVAPGQAAEQQRLTTAGMLGEAAGLRWRAGVAHLGGPNPSTTARGNGDRRAPPGTAPAGRRRAGRRSPRRADQAG